MTPFHDRAETGLRRPGSSISYNLAPAGITVHYGGPAIGGYPWDHGRCPTIWRAWQAFHQDVRKWNDIAYSSGVCIHGHRYEGRGPRVRTAAQGTNDGNLRSYAVCYIAGQGEPLTDPAKAAFGDEAGRFGVPLRWAHHEWHSTGCPGDGLSAWRRAGFPPVTSPPPAPGDTALPAARIKEIAMDYPTLTRGTTGHFVRIAQGLLLANMPDLSMAVDGSFGVTTERALVTWKSRAGLEPNGAVDTWTWLGLLGQPWQ